MPNQRCPLPWCGARIEADGTLGICCDSATHLRSLKKDQTLLTTQNVQSTQQILDSDTHRELRSQMEQNKTPEACKGCYELEKTEGKPGWNVYQTFLGSPLNFDKLQYIDIFTGNKCNLGCRMCDPTFSQSLIPIYNELSFLESHLPQKNISDFEDEKNFYHKILHEIKYINFQGGEPLISSKHKKILELIIEMGKEQEITLIYITNLAKIDPEILKLWSRFENISITISIDGIEDTLEYIRYPLQWTQLVKNLNELYKFKLFHHSMKLQTQFVFQAYNAHNAADTFYWMLSSKYFDSLPRAFYLTRPNFLAAHHLPSRFKERINSSFISGAHHTLLDKTNLSTCFASMNNLTKEQQQIERFIEFTRHVDNKRNQNFPFWSFYDNPNA